MRSIAASSGFSLLLRTRNRRHQIRSLSRRPWKSDSSSACQPWVFALEMASLVTNQPPLTINGHILGCFKMIQHGDSSPSDPKKLAVSVYSPARATHLGLRFGVTRGIRSKKSTENSRSFQVFPGLPHRWIATSRCRGSDWPRSARPLSAVAERSHASALPVASPWPQKNALNMLGCMQCIRENMYNLITIIS